jgi:hypothetical protein
MHYKSMRITILQNPKNIHETIFPILHQISMKDF